MVERDLTLAPLKVSPYKHQQQAIKFACRMFGISEQKRKTSGVALLMQMGTGKSLTAIGIAGTLYEKKKITKMCVVAPLSILSVWEEEFDKFANFPYTLLILKGTATPSLAQAIKMKKYNQDGKLTSEVIQSIMEEEKPNQKEKPAFRDERITKLIPKTVPRGQETDFVVKALEFYNRHLQRNKAHER